MNLKKGKTKQTKNSKEGGIFVRNHCPLKVKKHSTDDPAVHSGGVSRGRADGCGCWR